MEALMGDIGIEKLILLMIVVLLLFGAKRIPEIGQSLGRGIREFRRSMSDINKEILPPPAPYRPAEQQRTDVVAPAATTPTSAAEPKRLL
jgi:sec-independent protein translocase protein TatA